METTNNLHFSHFLYNTKLSKFYFLLIRENFFVLICGQKYMYMCPNKKNMLLAIEHALKCGDCDRPTKKYQCISVKSNLISLRIYLCKQNNRVCRKLIIIHGLEYKQAMDAMFTSGSNVSRQQMRFDKLYPIFRKWHQPGFVR